MEQAKIGIIGGSGLYQMDGLTDVTEVSVDTPFGKPSDNFILGTLEGQRVAFLARHGRGHNRRDGPRCSSGRAEGEHEAVSPLRARSQPT